MMMGFAVNSLDYPITKGSSGLLIFNSNSPLPNIMNRIPACTAPAAWMPAP